MYRLVQQPMLQKLWLSIFMLMATHATIANVQLVFNRMEEKKGTSTHSRETIGVALKLHVILSNLKLSMQLFFTLSQSQNTTQIGMIIFKCAGLTFPFLSQTDFYQTLQHA
jgi:hypothetical protein